MPWVIQGSTSGTWSAVQVERVYFNSYFVEDDYVEDEEWTLSPEPGDVWTLIP